MAGPGTREGRKLEMLEAKYQDFTYFTIYKTKLENLTS